MRICTQRALAVAVAFLMLLCRYSHGQRDEPDSTIELKLYGELLKKTAMHVNSIAFMSDGSTFAMPVDGGKVGVFRIKPETRTNVAPLTVAQRRTVAVFIAELDSDDFGKRERATRELLGIGPQIETQLRDALKNTDSTEAAYRLKHLLEKIAKLNSRAPVDRIDQIGSFQGLDSIIRSIEYSADDRKVLVAGYDSHLRILDGRTYRELRRLRVDDAALHATFSHDDRRIFAAMDNKVGIWDAETGKRETTLPAHAGEIYCLDVSADGRWLACSGVPKNVSLWDLKNPKRLHLLEGFGDSVGHLEFSPDSLHLACASEDGTLSVWDVASGKRLRVFGGHKDEVWNVTYSPNGARIATGGNDGEVVLRDSRSGRVLARLKGESSYGRHIGFSPNGRFVVTATAFGKTQVWKPQEARK